MAKQPLSHQQGLSGFSSFLCKWPPCGEDCTAWKFGVWTIPVETEPKSTRKSSRGPVSRSVGQWIWSLQDAALENRAPYHPPRPPPPLLLPSFSVRFPPLLTSDYIPDPAEGHPYLSLCPVLSNAWPFPGSDCHCCCDLLGDPGP